MRIINPRRMLPLLAAGVLLILAPLAPAQELETTVGRIQSLSAGSLLVGETSYALPPATPVHWTGGATGSIAALKTGDKIRINYLPASADQLPTATDITVLPE